MDRRNDGIQLSDPGLGMVVLDWEEVESCEIPPPRISVRRNPPGWGSKAQGDGGYNGQHGNLRVDPVGWGRGATLGSFWTGGPRGWSSMWNSGRSRESRNFSGRVVSINVGPTGVRVTHPVTEGASVTLRDGRVFEMDGSNDVDDSNHGIFILPVDSGWSPDDEEAEWIWVRWEDFQSLMLEWEDGP